jgi:hypothetical protein
MIVNNQLSQIALLYQLIEAHLRRAATSNMPMTFDELHAQGDINACAKNEAQIKDCVRSLALKGFIITAKRPTNGTPKNEMMWNLKAEPFIWGERKRRKMKEQPSKSVGVAIPILPMSKPRTIKPVGDIELLFGDTLIVIGRNVETGRMRIVLEDVAE